MKDSYREFFARCMEFCKMKYFLKIVGISPVTFSRFMKSPEFDYCLSVNKLQALQDEILSTFQNLA